MIEHTLDGQLRVGSVAVVILWAALSLLASPGPAAAQAPILASSHVGWKSIHCGSCHALPVADHTTTDTSECALCHGGNGACDPNGANSSKKNHSKTTGCSCHGTMHSSFTKSADCVSCHFATVGLVDCP